MTVKAIYELTTDAGQTVELSEQEYQQMRALTAPLPLRPQALVEPPPPVLPDPTSPGEPPA